jgi:plasmid stabilization system protein ParE
MLRVTVLRRARTDVESIYAWIRQRSPRGAEAWYSAFESAARKLAAEGASFSLAPEADRVGVACNKHCFARGTESVIDYSSS